MVFWIAILLGIIQGATEFLPVSSSGHLVLFYNIFNISDNTLLFSVLLHVATLAAVVYVYWKDIVSLIRNPLCKTNRLLLTATIPTVVIALLLKGLIEDSFSGGSLIICFFITGIILLISDYFSRKAFAKKKVAGIGIIANQTVTVQKLPSVSITDMNISYKQAVIVGVFQGLACFPGISRSGSTIAGGLILGIEKKDAADFSFLLSIPIILASLLLETVEFIRNPSPLPFPIIGILLGCLAAFVSGLFCVRLLLRLVKKQKLIWFSLYLFLLGTFLLFNKHVFFLF